MHVARVRHGAILDDGDENFDPSIFICLLRMGAGVRRRISYIAKIALRTAFWPHRSRDRLVRCLRDLTRNQTATMNMENATQMAAPNIVVSDCNLSFFMPPGC
jgi:hypothetical protein